MDLYDVVVGLNCSCHDMAYCPHGPLISTVVRADSVAQIENILALPPKFDVWVKKQSAINLDQLAAMADDVKDSH
jgi:hypothetical protein